MNNSPLAEPASHVDVNSNVYVAQQKLIEVVDGFMDRNNASSPVKALGDLLYRWVTSQTTNMTLQVNQDQLFTGFEIINLLNELNECKTNLDFVTARANRKEASNE